MAETGCAKFISKKIRKVRWQHPSAFSRPNPEYFVTGSWDDEVAILQQHQQKIYILISYYSLQQNEVSLWNTNLSGEQNIDPILVSTIAVPSDVNDICVSYLILIKQGSVYIKILLVLFHSSLMHLPFWQPWVMVQLW